MLKLNDISTVSRLRHSLQFDFESSLHASEEFKQFPTTYEVILPTKALDTLRPIAVEDGRLISEIVDGFANGQDPELADEGSGGTYFLFDRTGGRKIAVFKPADEEANAPNNPRGRVGEIGSLSCRLGIRSGEASVREVAAYMLDVGSFSAVPFTTIMAINHPKLSYLNGRPRVLKEGSVQKFAQHDETVGDMSPNMFSIREVHKIAILDIRIVNTDRNDGNILVKKRYDFKTKKADNYLIPIDHGYCLPDMLEIAWCDWIWMDWPQIKAPLDSETKEFIATLNPESDCEYLENVLEIRRECLINMKITTKLLQKGVFAGLSLYQIARIIARDKLEAPSLLEIIVAQARALARNAIYSKFGQMIPVNLGSKDAINLLRTPSTNNSGLNRSTSTVDLQYFKHHENHQKETFLGMHEILNDEETESFSHSIVTDSIKNSQANSLARRSSFTAIDLMEENSNEFEEEFWKFLDDLMDSLVKRKVLESSCGPGRSKPGKSIMPHSLGSNVLLSPPAKTSFGAVSSMTPSPRSRPIDLRSTAEDLESMYNLSTSFQMDSNLNQDMSFPGYSGNNLKTSTSELPQFLEKAYDVSIDEFPLSRSF